MLRAARKLITWTAASAGGQNFLGAPWVSNLIASSPPRLRAPIARSLLGWSPHYFIENTDAKREAERNRAARARLVREVVAAHLRPEHTVVDYGCGPGYMTRELGALAARVYGVDISAGALACARVLNAAPNVEYLSADALAGSAIQADVVVAIALAQHLRSDVLTDVLRTMRSHMRNDAKLLMHVVIDEPHWRTEREWAQDRSLRGRIFYRYVVHCFRRTREELHQLVQAAGFRDVEITAMAQLTHVEDDVARQHLLIAHAG